MFSQGCTAGIELHIEVSRGVVVTFDPTDVQAIEAVRRKRGIRRPQPY